MMLNLNLNQLKPFIYNIFKDSVQVQNYHWSHLMQQNEVEIPKTSTQRTF
jgi:hypothetical protein